MKGFLGTTLKMLGAFVLAVVALVMVTVMVHGLSHAAKQAAKNQAIKVLQMYASPPNKTLAMRLFVVKNTSGKTITAIKCRVDVFNKLKEKVDDTVVAFAKPLAPDSVVYCDGYSLFDSDGLPTDNGCKVDGTDRRLVGLAQQAGCKPNDLRVTDTYKVKVLSIAY